MKAVLLLALYLVSSFTLVAGDEPAMHLTGVPQVDFFRMRNAPYAQAVLLDSFPDIVQAMPSKEKSPWLAAGLSLLVPGAGEFYTGSYIKSAIFFGAEVGSIVTAYMYDRKGDDQTALFEAFANQHWSATRYAEWIESHIRMLNAGANWNSDVYNQSYYDDPTNRHTPPFESINWEELHVVERDIAEAQGNGFTHVLPFYGQQQYYELIGKYEQFSRGWDDSDLDAPFSYPPPISSNSQRFFEYAKMRAKANEYYDVTSAMLSVVVINHVLSAIDAAWSASQFNNALHAEVGLRMQPSPFGMVPVKEARVSYTF